MESKIIHLKKIINNNNEVFIKNIVNISINVYSKEF
jgi:hypothetical protein